MVRKKHFCCNWKVEEDSRLGVSLPWWAFQGCLWAEISKLSSPVEGLHVLSHGLIWSCPSRHRPWYFSPNICLYASSLHTHTHTHTQTRARAWVHTHKYKQRTPLIYILSLFKWYKLYLTLHEVHSLFSENCHSTLFSESFESHGFCHINPKDFGKCHMT